MEIKNAVGLTVETQHGIELGYVINVDIDPETHLITKYQVAERGFMKRLAHASPTLSVDPTQVVSISSEKMIVVDLNVGEAVNALEGLAPNNKSKKASAEAGISASSVTKG